jgi:TrmH family RNA methyltransferase
MSLKEIVSLQHPFVKLCVKLRTDKITRNQEKKIIISSEKVIQEISSFSPINVLITLSDLKSNLAALETYSVNENVMKKITGDVTAPSMAAIFTMPETKEISFFNSKKFLLGLDQLSDPGNVGSILRSALALGFEGVLFLGTGVDPFNDKCLRASRGSLFQMPYIMTSKEELEIHAKNTGKKILLADMQGQNIFKHSFKPPLVLILSSEGQGISEWKAPIEKISIPMEKSVESLNVGHAGAILMERLINS